MSDEPVHILAISGSMSEQSQTKAMLQIALAAAEEAGAQTRLADLAELDPPLMRVGDKAQKELDSVKEIREGARWADGYLFCTPEYHGGPSGALKNWFDFLWPELAGKVAGICATAGGRAADQSVTQLELYLRMLHCWNIPYNAQAIAKDFDDDNTLNDDRAVDRLKRLGRDVTVYAGLFRDQFAADKTRGKGIDAGFAAWHQF